jgi:hypothetical protein
MSNIDKFYLYIDESGQDTEGVYFLVAVVILPQATVNDLEEMLERIEQETGKQKRKWRGSRPRARMAFLERILQIPELERAVFYMSFSDTKAYTELTASAIAHAILERATGEYRAYITVDGLKDKERSQISRTLQRHGIKRRKLRGGREERNVFLRLVDIMAGFIRDYEEGKSYAQEIYRRFENQHIITKLQA